MARSRQREFWEKRWPPRTGNLSLAITSRLPSDESSHRAGSAGDAFVDQLSLADELWQEPFRFEFFAALRVLARMGGQSATTSDEPRPSIEADSISSRLHGVVVSALGVVDVKKLAGRSRAVEMTVAFLGLTGSMGAMPRPYYRD